MQEGHCHHHHQLPAGQVCTVLTLRSCPGEAALTSQDHLRSVLAPGQRQEVPDTGF